MRPPPGPLPAPVISSSTIDSPTYEDVLLAARRLTGIAYRTPVLTSRTADETTGAQVFFKCENLQRGGAFKLRGAYNAVALLPEVQRARGVVSYSSGNHAQALALAARTLNTRASIVMPKDAPAAKMNATRAYGGEIILYDRYREDRESIATELAARRGLALIPPFDHADIIAGQGTCAKELLEETGPLDVLVVPVGGGGLLSGSALSARALAPACAVFGVEPESADDARQSLRRGEIVTIAVPRSIADGALVTHVGTRCFPIIRAAVTDIVTVTDAQLVDALRFFVERMKIVVEPTGCLAAAAVLSGALPCRGKRVGVVLSGGNVDKETLARLLAA